MNQPVDNLPNFAPRETKRTMTPEPGNLPVPPPHGDVPVGGNGDGAGKGKVIVLKQAQPANVERVRIIQWCIATRSAISTG